MALYSQGEDLDSIVVGLSLDKTANDAQVLHSLNLNDFIKKLSFSHSQNPYVETAEGTCILAEDRELPREPAEDAILTLKFNFREKRLVSSRN